jgi:FkbH-like protein
MVLLHNFVAPQHPAVGIFDLREDLGQTALFARINLQLAEMARTRYSSVYIMDEDRIQAQYGKASATDARLWLTARIPWSGTVTKGLAKEYLKYIRASRGLSRKCIVLDLDNTLWGGVIGEDGVGGIHIGPDAPGNAFLALQRELQRLWQRGILLAICSKNNPEDVGDVFDRHPGMVLKSHHFSAQRINWEPKADNIRSIAKELNIGLDSLVFLDDNSVERLKVRVELPDVLVPELPADPALYRQALAELGVFDNLTFTEEDRKRNALYAEQRTRRDFLDSLGSEAGGGSVEEHLASLRITVDIAQSDELTLARIAQLTNKTNQFNLTTRRYSEAQIIEMQAGGAVVLGMTVGDRFGDAGLTGVAIVRPIDTRTWEIDTFLLSCRVMGRNVETALLVSIMDHLRENGVRYLTGWYLPTAKNAPVKDFYSQHGFSQVEGTEDGSELWTLDLAEARLAAPDWIAVRSALQAV